MATADLYDVLQFKDALAHINVAYEPWDGYTRVSPERDRELLLASRTTLCGLSTFDAIDGLDFSAPAARALDRADACPECRRLLGQRAPA